MKKLIALLTAVFLLLPGCGVQKTPDTGYTKYSAQFYGTFDTVVQIVGYCKTEEEFSRRTLGGVIRKYFENSYLGAVSALVEEEKISVDELRELIDRIETQNRR